MTELRQELTHLRSDAMRAGASDSETGAVEPISETERSLNSGPWRYADGNTITIVCSRWPASLLGKIPYTDIDDPDFIELLTYSELDALFELHGHLRAANPDNQVNLRMADELASDDYTSHLISLGGVDWNSFTRTALTRLPLPVRQIADWSNPGEQYFRVEENGEIVKHKPRLEENESQPKGILHRGRGAVRPGGQPLQPEENYHRLQRHVRPGHLRRCPGADRRSLPRPQFRVFADPVR